MSDKEKVIAELQLIAKKEAIANLQVLAGKICDNCTEDTGEANKLGVIYKSALKALRELNHNKSIKSINPEIKQLFQQIYNSANELETAVKSARSAPRGRNPAQIYSRVDEYFKEFETWSLDILALLKKEKL